MIPDAVLRAVLDPLAPAWRSDPTARDAAVLAPWFTREGRDFLLFIVRHGGLPHHAGEVAFPGGGRRGDEDAVGCALRETAEEIGLPAEAVIPLGCLGDRRSPAGFRVQAIVGRIEPPDRLRLDRGEVEAVLEVPVDLLRDAARWEYRDLGSGDRRRRVPFFAFEDRVLWGLTGWLTRDLIERLEAAGT